MKTISPESVHVSEGVIIDVRTPAEYGEVHIQDSELHPLHQLEVEEIVGKVGEAGKCFVVCGTGKRAGQAAEKLRAGGLKDVMVVEGGIAGWERAGKPVVRGEKVMSLERQVRIIAGFLVVLGVVLGYYVDSAFLLLSGFVGAGLIFAGITDFCGMGMLLARMPWNNRKGSCCG